MRAVVQRVGSAVVETDGRAQAAIDAGLLIYVGVSRCDEPGDAAYLAKKIAGLRIFPDDAGRMNLDVRQVDGQVLVVSAFTLMADARRGRRPSFEEAQRGQAARTLYESFCEALVELDVSVKRGVFGADMEVQCVNDGPVCILIDSNKIF